MAIAMGGRGNSEMLGERKSKWLREFAGNVRASHDLSVTGMAEVGVSQEVIGSSLEKDHI